MILLYHNICEEPLRGAVFGTGLPVSHFGQQLSWLKRHRRIVRLQDYLKQTAHGTQSAGNLVALTFDDGLATTFQRAYPHLKRYEAPATVFVSTAHLNGGDLLWFSYIEALCFDRSYQEIEVRGNKLSLSSNSLRRYARYYLVNKARESGNPQAFSEELSYVYYLSACSLAEFSGMTSEQLSLGNSSELIEWGAHTVNHPLLDLLSPQEQKEEIIRGKQELEDISGKSVRYFAYPNGDYNRDTLDLIEAAGFDAAFATHLRRVSLKPRYEITRIGIYSTSFFRFWLKAQGLVKPGLGRRIRKRLKPRKPQRIPVLNSG